MFSMYVSMEDGERVVKNCATLGKKNKKECKETFLNIFSDSTVKDCTVLEVEKCAITKELTKDDMQKSVSSFVEEYAQEYFKTDNVTLI